MKVRVGTIIRSRRCDDPGPDQQLVTQELANRYCRQRDAEVIVAAMLHSGMTGVDLLLT